MHMPATLEIYEVPEPLAIRIVMSSTAHAYSSRDPSTVILLTSDHDTANLTRQFRRLGVSPTPDAQEHNKALRQRIQRAIMEQRRLEEIRKQQRDSGRDGPKMDEECERRKSLSLKERQKEARERLRKMGVLL